MLVHSGPGIALVVLTTTTLRHGVNSCKSATKLSQKYLDLILPLYLEATCFEENLQASWKVSLYARERFFFDPKLGQHITHGKRNIKGAI
jgi:hypothetical protein